MSISCYCLNKFINKLANKFVGSKINAIHQLGANDFAFNCFNDGTIQLLVSLDPGFPLILASQKNDNTIMKSDNFTLAMKKYLEHGNIESMVGDPLNRLLFLTVSKLTPSYIKIRSKMIIELIPYRTNIIITDENDVIIDAKRKTDIASKHIIMRGVKYYAPTNIASDDPLRLIKSEKTYFEENFSNCEEGIKTLRESDTFFFDGRDIVSYHYNENFKEFNPFESRNLINKKIDDNHKDSLYHDVLKSLKNKIKTLNKKIITLEKEKISYQEHLDYSRIGNLLLTFSDSYSNSSNQIIIDSETIKLDSRLNLYQNAERYFKLYRKAKTGLINLDTQIEKAKEEILYLEEKNVQIENGRDEDISEIIEELQQEGYLKNKATPKKIKKDKKPQIHLLKRKDKATIGIGLTSIQNEYLTFTLANKHDTFMHVKDHHGPHVIIFDNNPDNESLLLAAEASLYFASLNEGDVMVAKRSDVKKATSRGRVNILEYHLITIHKIREESVELFKNMR